MRKRPASSMDPVRVACIGDSNTVGGGLGLSNRYPAQLQKLLDARIGPGAYEVRAFGRNGATAAPTVGKCHYQSTARCSEALRHGADVYAVMLGTNDAWHHNGEPDQVANGLAALMRLLRQKSPVHFPIKASGSDDAQPQVLLVLPPGAKSGRLKTNLQNIVHPAVRNLATESGATLVEPRLHAEKSYRLDLVHLSLHGAKIVAAAVTDAILLNKRRKLV
eukprot:TRINITY_DN44871_c0_g1_i1.p1 TRINITY_DN44871_c0_g1~~TRINITY_DN44871_c0_g1_i1.p1  ORF type:complete len:220 (+),score=20.88 TRINITY_DN44871_c0_g1_i1:190-849(+)